jgi:hypothetical protein
MKNLILVFAMAFIPNAAFAQEAKLLSPTFYKLGDVCADAKKTDPSKKAAVVLIKTHLCDVGTGVCIDSLRTFDDPANVFIRDNFVSYHTRFIGYDLDPKSGVSSEHFAGEDVIRSEWKKPDSNPEAAIIDLSTCTVMGRRYLKNFPGFNDNDFLVRYKAIRKAILDIPGVAKLLGKSKDGEDYKLELAKIGVIRANGGLERTRPEAFSSLVNQSKASGVIVATSEVAAENFSNLSEVNAMVHEALGDDSKDPVLTVEGKTPRSSR